MSHGIGRKTENRPGFFLLVRARVSRDIEAAEKARGGEETTKQGMACAYARGGPSTGFHLRAPFPGDCQNDSARSFVPGHLENFFARNPRSRGICRCRLIFIPF